MDTPPTFLNTTFGFSSLEAIENQVSSAGDMVGAMIDEVMGVEPSPFREDLVVPLETVRNVAGDIAEKIDAVMGFEPAPFREAALTVMDAAEYVVGVAEEGIELFSGPPPLICGDLDEEQCIEVSVCEWVAPAGADPYCRNLGY